MKNFCLFSICACISVLFIGCGPIGVPRSATICSQGQHPGCTSPAAGRFWIYDKTSGGLIVSDSINRNQDISVDPAANQVTIDGNPIPINGALRTGDDYQIFFNAAGK